MPERQTAAGPISPTELAGLLPDPPLLLSDQTATAGVGVAHYHRRRSDFQTPPMRNHLIMLNIGPPARLLQAYRGHSREERILNGDLTLLPAGEDNRWRWERDTTLLHLYVSPAFVATTAASADLNADTLEIVYRAAARDPVLQQIGTALWTEAQSPGIGGQLYVDSLASLLALHLLRRHSSASRPAPVAAGGLSPSDLRRAVAFIQENLDSELRLADMAAAVSLSPCHFLRRFKQATGLAPHQYVIQARVEAARRLLLTGEVSVGQAASRVGFAHQSQFALHCRRLLGVTPREILRESKNPSGPLSDSAHTA